MSISWPSAVNPAPRLLALPAGVASLDEADAAVELWEHYRGRQLDPGQRLDVAMMLATRADGMWAASVTGHEKPRQSGKGDSIEVVELWGLTQRAERILHTIHDAVLLATETQSRMLSLLSHPDLRGKVARSWKGTGQQMIELRNGGTIWYRTRTGAGGRGIDEVDRAVIDEAQHAEHHHLAAITPTQAVSENPQLNALGTGALDGKSEWWWSLRKQAKGVPGAFGWAGWSAQEWTVDDDGRVTIEPVDPSDRSLWWETIPGLVAGRTTIDFLEREFRLLGPDGFAQEYLCVWAPPVDAASDLPIDPIRWEHLIDGDSLPSDDSVRLALDVTPDRRAASFAVAGKRADNLLHVSQRYHLAPHMMSGLVQMAAGLVEYHGVPLVIPAGSPALAWRSELESAGVEVDVMSPADTAAAFGYLVASVEQGNLRHRGSPEMASAVAGLTTKRSGDVEVPVRRTSSVNISPVIAAMCALYRVPQSKGRQVAEAHIVVV